MKNTPPKLAENFLQWILKPELSEEILGDLEENFLEAAEQKTLFRAKLNYWYQTLNYLRPFALRSSIFSNLNPFFMLRHHILVSLRGFKRNTSTFLINTFSLTLGVTCCLLIGLYIFDEFSYDQQHPNIDNLYRVVLDINLNDWNKKVTALPPVLPPKLVEEIPGIKQAARLNPYFSNAGTNLLRKENETINHFEEKFVYVDPSFFELFHLPLIYGNAKKILNDPFQIVITKHIADKYFPGENPVGKTLMLNNSTDEVFTITGVTNNIPTQSHFEYDYFMSMASLKDSEENTNWLFNNYYAYVLLEEGFKVADIQDKLAAFSTRHFGPQFKAQQNIDLEAIAAQGQYYRVNLQPVKDIHLYSADAYPQLKPTGDISNVRLFLIIALFILLIAVVNFINLSTARSTSRAHEVGVRKVLGSTQQHLVRQFLCESVLISLAAFVAGTLLAHFLMPMFNELSGKQLFIPFTNISFLLLLSGMAFLMGILAGLYPSFYLSAFEPIKVLKGKLNRVSSGGRLRGGLVVVQFTISIALIIGTFVVYQQMAFIQDKKIGFEKEQVLLIQDTYTLNDQVHSFKNAIKDLPEAQSTTLSSYLPLEGGNRNSISFYPEGKNTVDDQVLLQRWSIDTDYIETLGMTITEGRNFKEGLRNDSLGVILNETAIKDLGFSDNPIGQKISSPYAEDDYTIVGVVKDFNYESLKGKVSPVGLFLGLSNSVISIKTSSAEMEALITKAESTWKSFAPNQPFRYDFLDDRFAVMYTVERRIGKLFLIFSVIAIFIACLGLLALVTFMTEQRIKEIGIRKVLGASAFNIVKMLSADFTKMVLIAIVLAFPLSYWAAHKWLNNFAYHTDIQLWIFIGAGILALLVAWLTVGLRSLKAALANPVESLKVE